MAAPDVAAFQNVDGKTLYRHDQLGKSLRLKTFSMIKNMKIELIPSAKRLIRSLRDVGYEFVDAVADIVDNSVEARATVICINLKFDGTDSYLTIGDNGIGMASKEIQEALRFGSNRAYDAIDDLGRYGLGLKTASLSQCERLTVSSRRGEERARINSYCWDLAHIENTNRWEILKITSEELKHEVWNQLQQTTGTVVTWERLGRLMGYKYPTGENARKHADQMAHSLKTHLAMVFHRFLSGEVHEKRIAIYVNDERVAPWDPYSRGEKYTQKLDHILIPLQYEERAYNVRAQPYILPPQSLYSSTKAHLQASGPGKWNKQQGIYIYRSNRIVQAGGWSGLRTSDEHTKLVRIAVFIPSQLDELFQVNVAKKHLTLPRELRVILAEKIQPIIQRAQEVYREKTVDSSNETIAGNAPNEINKRISLEVLSHAPIEDYPGNSLASRNSLYKLDSCKDLIAKVAAKAGFPEKDIGLHALVKALFEAADDIDKRTLERILEKYLAHQN